MLAVACLMGAAPAPPCTSLAGSWACGPPAACCWQRTRPCSHSSAPVPTALTSLAHPPTRGAGGGGEPAGHIPAPGGARPPAAGHAARPPSRPGAARRTAEHHHAGARAGGVGWGAGTCWSHAPTRLPARAPHTPPHTHKQQTKQTKQSKPHAQAQAYAAQLEVDPDAVVTWLVPHVSHFHPTPPPCCCPVRLPAGRLAQTTTEAAAGAASPARAMPLGRLGPGLGCRVLQHRRPPKQQINKTLNPSTQNRTAPQAQQGFVLPEGAALGMAPLRRIFNPISIDLRHSKVRGTLKGGVALRKAQRRRVGTTTTSSPPRHRQAAS